MFCFNISGEISFIHRGSSHLSVASLGRHAEAGGRARGAACQFPGKAEAAAPASPPSRATLPGDAAKIPK